MYLKFLFFFLFLICGIFSSIGSTKIDRKSLVDRHKVITNRTNLRSPAQIGNGEFAMGVDITGLQTFVPFNILSQWGWHSFALPEGKSVSDYKPVTMVANGRSVPYEIPNPEQPELSSWLAMNPHRFNLGRIGLKMWLKNGKQATEKDLTESVQEVDLWRGIITSRFKLEGTWVCVQTACHPQEDRIGVSIKSRLLEEGRLFAFISFPYPDAVDASYLGTYKYPQKHQTRVIKSTNHSVSLQRDMDGTQYFVGLNWDSDAFFDGSKINQHYVELHAVSCDSLYFNCLFSPREQSNKNSTEDIFRASAESWREFWNSGAAVDFSQSKDVRWKELERRVVLSQYLMKVNEAGSLPPQESGLVNNGWYGRFHFEMIWWHGVHYALWNRWNLLDESLFVYRKFLPTSIERAEKQGYKGARWPKCTADIDREWPHLIHATLVWQQPHPIYFAELDYRLHPTKETLEKWKEVVFKTADFMADLLVYDKSQDRYILAPPLFIVSENTDPMKTVNPTFELGYWRFGLRTALEWCRRLLLPVPERWKLVEDKMASLPVENGTYVVYEGIEDMWGKYAFEHPALLGVYGMLPGDGVDKQIFLNTLEKVSSSWNFNHVWGWDFPMLAMAAARCGKPQLALEYLLHPSPNFQFDEHGLATGGPFPYLPSNGALLTAIAMMVEGWDGSAGKFPGFPQDGSWVINAENFNRMP